MRGWHRGSMWAVLHDASSPFGMTASDQCCQNFAGGVDIWRVDDVVAFSFPAGPIWLPGYAVCCSDSPAESPDKVLPTSTLLVRAWRHRRIGNRVSFSCSFLSFRKAIAVFCVLAFQTEKCEVRWILFIYLREKKEFRHWCTLMRCRRYRLPG